MREYEPTEEAAQRPYGATRHSPSGLAVALARDLAGSLQQQEVVRRILDRAVDTLNADRATLSSLSPDGVVIEALAGRTEDLRWVGRSYPIDMLETQPAVWQAVQHRAIVLSAGLDATRARPEFQEALLAGRSVAVMPLVHDERVAGLLVVTRFHERPYGDDDLPAMEIIAGVAAVALRNAALHRELQETVDALAATVAAARDLAATSDVDALGRSLLDHAVMAAHADDGALLRIEDGTAVVVASTGADPAGSRYPAAGATLRALREAEPAQFTAAEYAAEHADSAHAVSGYQRFLIVPLLVGGEQFGVLALARQRDAGFSAGEQAGVRQIATLAALLMRNARLLDQARETNEARWEFVNLAVHELRTPLALVRGYSSMLDERIADLPDFARPAVATLGTTATRLSNVIDDMLFAARLDTRRLGVAATDTDIVACVAQAVERGAAAARLRAGRIRAALPSEPATICADPAMVGRVLDNLIGNAVKYSDHAPDVEVSLLASTSHVDIRVRDQGPGVPDSFRPNLFGMFARGSESLPGTGLGLYLSRGLAELMGGELTLETTGDARGTVFLLRLPHARG